VSFPRVEHLGCNRRDVVRERPAVHSGTAVGREHRVAPTEVGDAPRQDVHRLFGKRDDMRARLAAPSLTVLERDHARVQIHVRAAQPQELRRTLAPDLDTDLDRIAPGVHRLSAQEALQRAGPRARRMYPGIKYTRRLDGTIALRQDELDAHTLTSSHKSKAKRNWRPDGLSETRRLVVRRQGNGWHRLSDEKDLGEM